MEDVPHMVDIIDQMRQSSGLDAEFVKQVAALAYTDEGVADLCQMWSGAGSQTEEWQYIYDLREIIADHNPHKIQVEEESEGCRKDPHSDAPVFAVGSGSKQCDDLDSVNWSFAFFYDKKLAKRFAEMMHDMIRDGEGHIDDKGDWVWDHCPVKRYKRL